MTNFCRSKIQDPTLKKCPCCNKEDEDQTHFINCSANPKTYTRLGSTHERSHRHRFTPIRHHNGHMHGRYHARQITPVNFSPRQAYDKIPRNDSRSSSRPIPNGMVSPPSRFFRNHLAYTCLNQPDQSKQTRKLKRQPENSICSSNSPQIHPQNLARKKRSTP